MESLCNTDPGDIGGAEASLSRGRSNGHMFIGFKGTQEGLMNHKHPATCTMAPIEKWKCSDMKQVSFKIIQIISSICS